MIFFTVIAYLLLRSVADASPFVPQSQSSVTNLTYSDLDGPSNPNYNCFPPQEEPFAPASCSSIFTQFLSFPHWADTQEFLEGVRPQIVPEDPGTTPPFFFIDEGGECTMLLKARRSDLSDRFSWQEVARIGREITRRCPRDGGYSYVGEAGRWYVGMSSSFKGQSLGATNESIQGAMVTGSPRSQPQTTSSLVLSPTSHQFNASTITCWKGLDHIGLPACGTILQNIAAFPNYEEIQTFEEGVRPRLRDSDPESVPPFLFHRIGNDDVSCSVILQSNAGSGPENFSWRQVVRASQAISIECGSPGPGGWTPIGEDHKWFLSVSRFDLL